MKIFFASLAAFLAVTAHGAAIGTQGKSNAGSGQPDPKTTIREDDRVLGGAGGMNRNTLTLQLDPKPKAKCVYDMNTFVEGNLNYGTDGGLYAEMIRNRAFQSPDDAGFSAGANDAIGSGSLTGWQPVDDSKVELIKDKPLSVALPQSAKITCDAKKSGACGIKNLGFFGMPVEAGETYKASFFIRTDTNKKINLRYGLYNNDLTEKFAEFTENLEISDKWQPLQTVLKPTKGADNLNNVFAIVVDGVESFQVNLISLFPTTFEGTVARKDLAQKMLKFKPRAIRYPGGNDLGGHTIASRFQWNNTIGPLVDRPGRLGNWAGWNTEGLGVVEMYNFISKVGARLIVGLWAGVDANSNTVPLADFEPHVRQQVEFAHFLLDTEGEWADLRVKSGGPKEPYDVQAFVIGNEVGLTPTVPYQIRFDKIVDALKKDFKDHKGFEDIDIIASAPIVVPTGAKFAIDLINQPIYGVPADFVHKYHMYDAASRTNNTLFYNMEFAVINSGMEPDQNIWFGTGRLHHSIIQGSLAETIFILGMENNCDIVRGAAYAPELANESDKRASQSTPGLLEFDTTKVVGSTSWLMQSLVSANRISESLAIKNTKELEQDDIYASAGLDDKHNVVVKIVNYSKEPKTVTINTGVPLLSEAKCSEVAGQTPVDSNTLQKQTVRTATCQAKCQGTSVSVELKKWSMTVITAPVQYK